MLLNDRVVDVVVEQADEASDNTVVVDADADVDASDDAPYYPSKDCADDADCDVDSL